MKIRFDQGPKLKPCRFEGARHLIVADSPREVPGALEALTRAQADGAWLAGYASYELGYALEPHLAPLQPPGRRLPLLCFGVYDGPMEVAPVKDGPAALSGFHPRWSEGTYARVFGEVHDFIGAGDIYQANLTFPVDMAAEGTPDALYAALAHAQPVRHGALVQGTGGPDILSRSPELFFRTDAAGRIETRPMKGTQPRGDDPAEDARRCAHLAQDEKNRAENLMIVDLLRNDISRICAPGSVRVPELFSIESYETVHQMTSLVTGELRPDAGLGEIFHALFPCGSITGAPKLRAMEILSALEAGPRDIYCGTIGWAAPDGRAEFSVAIRTLMVEHGQAVLGVGGGVVHDSTAAAEYEEALWKTRFARRLIPAFA
ncbi:aminodeoxychorismate synthase component I [Roseovarius salis]|uniref:aminodeoxychorismate synthase component I n=1 Tax=Roseovarius salis TaxID=3376063 RepID=UPI0037C7A4D6